MKQIATVSRMVGTDMAEVTVVRQSACSHDCANCAGCTSQPSVITVRARCGISVSEGDKVEVYSDNRVLGYAVLVYLVPLALFLLGYFLFPDQSETVRYITGGSGFVLGIVLAVVCDRIVRRNNMMSYQILRKI